MSGEIGIVGVGDMGAAIARALVRAGHRPIVFDLDQEALERCRAAGCTISGSVRNLADETDIVLVVVVDDGQLAAVVLDREAGIIAAERPPHTVLIHSTVHPDSVRAAEEGLAAKNIACLDAAVTGGSSAADHSVLTCFVGGSDAALAAVRPVIDAYCRIVHLVGPVGAGQVAKLTNNVMSIINSVVAFEALAICDAWGIDPEGIRQAIAAGGTGSSRALAGTDESGFGTPWEKRAASLGGQPWAGSPGRAPKDLLLARSLAEAAGVSTPMLAAAIGGTRTQAH